MREIAVALLVAWSSAAAAEPPGSAENTDCTAAIATAERSSDIPAGLLAAIAQVESGRRDPVYRTVRPWPWTINAGGVGHFFATKAEAVAATAESMSRGMMSVDVGCLQVNLAYHPAAFASLEEAFDPFANSLYAAQYLRLLFSQTGDWPAAVAAYHSQTHEVGAAYQGKVLAVWTLPGAATARADSRSPEFNPANWISADSRDRNRWWAVLTSGSSASRPITPSVPSAWVERVIAAVAGCAMATEIPSPLREASSETVRARRGSAGDCAASPFAKPAALRQLLAGPSAKQGGE